MAKKKQFVTAAAAFAVAASAVAPAITADAASTTVQLSSDYVRGGDLDAALDKEYKGSEIYWYKSSVDMNKLGVFQTAKGFVKGQGIRVEKKLRVLNHAQDIQPEEIVLEEGVPASGLRIQPVLFADGVKYNKVVTYKGFSTEKAGEFEGTFTYSNKAFGVVTKTVKYKVVATKVELSEVKSEVMDDVLSVTADVKNLKDGEKVELVVYANRDMNAALPAVQAEVKDGKLSVKSGKLPAGNHSFILRSGEVKTDVMNFVVEAPMVKDVKAINAKQIQVAFNKEVDASTVIGADAALKNISIAKVGAVASTGLTAKLSDDKKSLVITAANGETFNGSYVVSVSDSVKAVSGAKFAPTSQILNVEDKVAPTFVSASAVAKTTTKEVTLKFDEPVVSDGVIAYVNGAVAVVGAGASSNELKVTTSQELKAGEALTIRLTNVKDFAGNYTTPNPLEVTTTVVADVAAPKVVSAEVYGEDAVKVTFDKALDATQASTLGSKVRLLAANGTAAGTFANAASIDGKTAIFTLTTPAFDKDGKLAGTFYLDKGVKDTLGNESAELFTKQLSFQKDTVAPLVASISYKDNNIVASYTEEVAITNGTVVTAINKATGSVNTITLNTANGGNTTLSTDEKTVTISNHGLVDGTYELRLPAGIVKDKSAAQNSAAYFTTTLVIKNSVATENDTTKPVVTFTSAVDGVTPVDSMSTASEYKFTFDLSDNAGINFDSVLNTSNYTYAGKALPANSYVTTDATSVTDKDVTVTVHVPKKSVSTTVNEGLFSVVNIKDAAGNPLAAVANTKVTLTDGVAPELKSAVISSGDKTTLVVELTEEVVGLDAAGDLVLTVDGAPVVVSGVDLVTAGTDKGKYYITGTDITDFTAKSTITLALKEDTTGTVVEDAAGNDAIFGQAIKIK
ncbi:hypothetical protein OKS35_08350 [Exiguobacterium sp. N5]|uniref:hypothetical protein n=1 Tax=Exiguobacterium sp. N5 TaxID=2990450 RepID=UPI0021F40327|nr:hypothetical protein [Exiguobacterium sp. N5]MCV9900136.1 hypothetical protein [Exiguobacterium sp. N5]